MIADNRGIGPNTPGSYLRGKVFQSSLYPSNVLSESACHPFHHITDTIAVQRFCLFGSLKKHHSLLLLSIALGNVA